MESGVCMAVSLILYYVLFASGKYLKFNRIYLLSTILLALGISFVEIETNFSYPAFDTAHFNLDDGSAFTQLRDSPDLMTLAAIDADAMVQVKTVAFAIYVLGVLFMAFRYLNNLFKLKELGSGSERIDMGSYQIVLTDERIGPFTFMNRVFVSRDDYRQNKIPEAIWTHELTHVRQYHSIDIILIELLLVFFYVNPLLWIYRYAIRLNHEYTADENALGSHTSLETYAYQLIQYTHSGSRLLLECRFNYTSTKKRLIMLTKTRNNKLLFGNKIVLATVFVIGTAAMLSFQPVQESGMMSADKNAKLVIIDLGHGGNDPGALSANGRVKEVEIINAIGDRIRELDSHSNFIYTRADENVSLQSRAQMAAAKKAGLLLSIHIGASENKEASGVEVFYSNSNVAAEQSKRIGEAFADKLEFRKGSEPAKIKTADFKVLADSQCPSVLLTLGFISNESDLGYLTNKQNQKELAAQIVEILSSVN